MLAVVFVVFSDREKDKFRKLLVHKRRACQYAFRLLVTRSRPTHILFKHFHGLLRFFRPGKSHRDAYLIFKTLNRSDTGALSLEEFYNVYDICGFSWGPQQPPDPWFDDLPQPLRATGYLIRRLVTWRWFKLLVYAVITLNAVVVLINTIIISSTDKSINSDLQVTWDQIAFVSFYAVEASLKIIGLGLLTYLSSGWNVWDLVITLLAIGGLVAESFANSFFYIIILRPLRLLRLFRMRQRYRDVFQTFVILMPRIASAIIVIIITYYFFAIIGMELFSQYDMKNCCVNTTVEQFYKDDNTTVYVDYYYLNTFDNIFISGVTLFELTVVNNWFIIMEGYAAVSSDWSRLYFMVFYLVMMVVMSLVVAFILEAFTFRMEYNHTVPQDKEEDEEQIHIGMELSKEELQAVDTNPPTIHIIQALQAEGVVRFMGRRRRTRVVLQRRMYQDEIPGWLLEADQSPSGPGLFNNPRTMGQQQQSSPTTTHTASPTASHAASLTNHTAPTVSSPVPSSSSSSVMPIVPTTTTSSWHCTPQQTPPSYLGGLNPSNPLSFSESYR